MGNLEPEALNRSQCATGSQRTASMLVEQYITRSILVFRGHKVLLDEDLAILYDVATKVLLQAVKRHHPLSDPRAHAPDTT